MNHATYLIVIATLLLPAPAVAQNTLLDHARRAVQDAANAGKKGLSDEANRQVSSAVENVATQDVADGSFVAILSPWSSADNTKRIEIARYSGQAYEATAPTGRQIVLCDNQGTVPWQVTLTVSNPPAALPAGSRGTTSAPAASRAPASTRGVAAPSTAKSGPSATSGSGGSNAPSAGQTDYRFPSTAVSLTLPATGARSGVPAAGSIRVAELSQTIYAGVGKVRFLKATIPGDKTPDVVDLGMSFKARVLTASQAAGGCAAIAHLNLPALARTSADSGKTKVATAEPSAPGRSTPASASPASAAAASTGPTFAPGDVLLSKIDQVKLLAEAKDSAKVTTTLKKTDELVYLGDEQNGYIHVQGSNGEGWVRKVLVIKRP